MLTVYIVFILSIAQLMWLDHIKGPFIYYIQARADWGFGAGGTILNRPNFGGSILKMHKM